MKAHKHFTNHERRLIGRAIRKNRDVPKWLIVQSAATFKALLPKGKRLTYGKRIK